MPVADLPYRISSLKDEGQYAYLTYSQPRTKEGLPANLKLRVLKNVTLCDGPTLWDAIRAKKASIEDPYLFFVTLRLFATRKMVEEYISSPEIMSYCKATGSIPPEIKDTDPVISEESYLTDQAVEIAKTEYRKMLDSRNGTSSLKDLEDLVCQYRGISSIEAIAGRKRGRKKKTDVVVHPPPSIEEIEHKTIEKKRRNRITLRDQYLMVQNTPSRVIDVSAFGDTMQHQHGKILHRVKNAERIAQCTSLPDLFPIISDNLPAFERAMASLGSRFTGRVAEFRIQAAKAIQV